MVTSFKQRKFTLLSTERYREIMLLQSFSIYMPRHEISNNVVNATSKCSDLIAQSDQSTCLSHEYSMSVKLLT